MASARPAARQTAAQNVANGIKKSYNTYLHRRNRRPRGLQNVSNTCYRNGALQTLLHLPKFVSWIMQHNKSRQNWPCADDDPNRTLPALNPTPKFLDGKLRNEPAIKALGEDAMGCVPCLFKNLIGGYWGDILMNEATGEPNPLPINHESCRPMHQLARRWFYGNPSDMEDRVQGRIEVLKEELGDDWDIVTAEEEELMKETARQQFREEQMDGQQDSDEFARKILGGIQNTFLGDTPAAVKRKSQYDSLFTRLVRETRTCDTCEETIYDNIQPELGFRITPLPPGQPDDIVAAMDRAKTETLGDVPCHNCKEIRRVQQHFRTVTAPEYLWVVSNVSATDSKGGAYKNRNPIRIQKEIDIISHMTYGEEPNAAPVRYGLHHVVYHAGSSLTFGHYAAAVTGIPQPGGNRRNIPGNEFFCDDSTIDEFTNALMPNAADVNNVLTANPVNISKPGDKKKKLERTPFDPYILIYVRLLNRKEPKRRMPYQTVSSGSGGIAQRVRDSPRVRRKPIF